MRSRLAIMAVLATGILMSGAGAGLALSGPSGSGSAGVAQYGAGGVLPDTGSNTPTTTTPDAGTLGAGGDNAPDDTQVTRQVATDTSNNLPFTGYAAIPILLMGVALLALGITMRGRVTSHHS